MIIVKNRHAFVEIWWRDTVIFRKNKPPVGGGLAQCILESVGLKRTDYGVHAIMNLTDIQCEHIKAMNKMDGRRASDREDIATMLADLRSGEYDSFFVEK